MPVIFEKVRQIAADVLQVPDETITLFSSPESIETWDSVQHLNLVLALEREFQLQFDPEEMDQMRTIGDIASIVEKRKIRPDDLS